MNAKLFRLLLYVNLSVDLILLFQGCVTVFLVMWIYFLDERKIAIFFLYDQNTHYFKINTNQPTNLLKNSNPSDVISEKSKIFSFMSFARNKLMYFLFVVYSISKYRNVCIQFTCIFLTDPYFPQW
jgi:hypothetical protein